MFILPLFEQNPKICSINLLSYLQLLNFAAIGFIFFSLAIFNPYFNIIVNKTPVFSVLSAWNRKSHSTEKVDNHHCDNRYYHNGALGFAEPANLKKAWLCWTSSVIHPSAQLHRQAALCKLTCLNVTKFIKM